MWGGQQCICAYECNVLRALRRVPGPLESELQAVVNLHVGAGIWSWVLWKSSKHSSLPRYLFRPTSGLSFLLSYSLWELSTPNYTSLPMEHIIYIVLEKVVNYACSSPGGAVAIWNKACGYFQVEICFGIHICKNTALPISPSTSSFLLFFQQLHQSTPYCLHGILCHLTIKLVEITCFKY